MAAVRYYIITMSDPNETIRLGELSARACLDTIALMGRKGWRLDRIQRGTETICLADLGKDGSKEAPSR